MKITPEMLKAKHACRDQLARFTELFPDGVEITADICVKHAREFNFDWAAEKLLSKSQSETYKKAVAILGEAFRKDENPLWANYWKAHWLLWESYTHAPLWETHQKSFALLKEFSEEAGALILASYEKDDAPLRKTFDKANAILWAEYKKTHATILEAYEKGRALAFFNAVYRQ